MRFNLPRFEFPLPILRGSGTDSNYINSDLQFEIELDIASSPIRANIQLKIDQPEITQLVSNKKATISLAVHCEETYFYELYDLSNKPKQSISLDESALIGSVYFTAIVKAVKDIAGFTPSNLEQGFSGLNFAVRIGDILAISEEIEHHFQLPPEQLGEDIFDLIEQPDMNDLEFEVNLNSPKIEVGVGTELNKLIQKNMATANGRVNNISAIYLPVLIEVLYQIKESDFSGKVWFEAIRRTATSMSLDINEDEPLRVAQKLLQYPYEQLLNRD
jgi:hypothetical protein